MRIAKREQIAKDVLPGRALQRAVGANSLFETDTMSVCYATYCAEYGPMEPHHHAEETIVVVSSDGGRVEWGPAKDNLPHKAELSAGDVLHIPENEWHVFRFREGGSLDVVCIYGKTDNLRPEDKKQAEKPSSGMLIEQGIALGLSLPDKSACLDYLSARAMELGLASDETELRAAFDEREAEGTTGLIDGFAVPHAKSSAIKKASVLVVRNERELEGWEALDDTPIDMVVALLIPAEEAGTTHLKLLSNIARMIMDEGIRASLRGAKNPKDVVDLIEGNLETV